MINVQDCLKDFRCKIGVSDEAPINLKECFLKLNILVLFKDMTDNVKGLSVKDSETGLSAILINSKLSVGKQHETIAHELFHVLYDDTLGSESSEMNSLHTCCCQSAVLNNTKQNFQLKTKMLFYKQY